MKNLSLYILLSITTFILAGCSSHNEIVSVSAPHHFDRNFGLVPNDAADRQVHTELLSMSLPTELEIPRESNPEWSTELVKDSDAFYAHEYVQEEDVITYKYKFDKKFYKTAEWRSAQF